MLRLPLSSLPPAANSYFEPKIRWLPSAESIVATLPSGRAEGGAVGESSSRPWTRAPSERRTGTPVSKKLGGVSKHGKQSSSPAKASVPSLSSAPPSSEENASLTGVESASRPTYFVVQSLESG